MLHTSDVTMVVSCFSALAAVIIGRKLKHILWYYALASLGADVLSLVLLKCDLRPILIWVQNVFVIFEVLVINWYVVGHSSSMTTRKLVMLLAIIGSCWYMADRLCNLQQQHINYVAVGILYAAMIVLMLWPFYKVIREVEVQKIEQSPLFIFSSGFLLYLSGSLVALLVFKYATLFDHELRGVLWIIRLSLNILKNGAVAYSLYLYGKSRAKP